MQTLIFSLFDSCFQKKFLILTQFQAQINTKDSFGNLRHHPDEESCDNDKENSYAPKQRRDYFEYSRLQIFQDLKGTMNLVKNLKSFIFKTIRNSAATSKRYYYCKIKTCRERFTATLLVFSIIHYPQIRRSTIFMFR